MTFDPKQSPVERVNYATGMMLSAEDFRAEQQYHRNRLAQFLRFAIGNGTIAGLAVEGSETWRGWERAVEQLTAPDYMVYVHPGLAIDDQGGLIEVTRPYKISLKRWVESNAKLVSENLIGGKLILDITVSARDLGRAKTPAFADGPFDALDAVVPSRIEDGFLLDVVPRKDDPQAPANLASGPATSEQQLKKILDGWQKVMGGDSGMAQGDILLARIRNCSVSAVGAGFVLNPGQNLTIDNAVRPVIWIAGQTLARIPS